MALVLINFSNSCLLVLSMDCSSIQSPPKKIQTSLEAVLGTFFFSPVQRSCSWGKGCGKHFISHLESTMKSNPSGLRLLVGRKVPLYSGSPKHMKILLVQGGLLGHLWICQY